MSNDDDYNDEPDYEEFPVANLLEHFQKNKIQVHGLFSFEGRIIFLYIQFITSGLSIFLYVPSKFVLKPDSSVKNYMHISMSSDEEESKQDSIFVINQTASLAGPKEKKSYISSLNRFIPLVEESKYKLLFVNKEMIVYINRYNEVETFNLNSPFNKKGFFYMTDLESFYNTGEKLEKELLNMEILFSNRVYNTIDNEVSGLKDVILKITNDLKTISGRMHNETFNNRIKRVNEVINKYQTNPGKQVTECIELASKIRENNFETMIYLEKLTFFLKELKDII